MLFGGEGGGGGRKLFQSYGVHWIQKISILTPWRLFGNSKGERRGVSKTNIFNVQFVWA